MRINKQYQRAKEAVKDNPFKTFLTAFLIALAGGVVNLGQKALANHEESQISITHNAIKTDLLKDETEARYKDLDADIDSIKEILKHKK